MRIVVCIKHVPDVQSERRIEDGRLVRGEEDVLNELDENAVEAAVCLAEEADGEVIALTMGPEDAEDGVRRALQMGADSGVVVADDDLAGADVVTTARVLAAAIERIGEVDLVVTGMASLDSMTSMLPGALAAALHLPALTLANRLEVDGGAVTVTRTVGTVREVLGALGTVRFDSVAAWPGHIMGVGTVGGDDERPGTPIVCLPGDPVSAQVCFEVFVRPALRHMQGWTAVNRPVPVSHESSRHRQQPDDHLSADDDQDPQKELEPAEALRLSRRDAPLGTDRDEPVQESRSPRLH